MVLSWWKRPLGGKDGKRGWTTYGAFIAVLVVPASIVDCSGKTIAARSVLNAVG